MKNGLKGLGQKGRIATSLIYGPRSPTRLPRIACYSHHCVTDLGLLERCWVVMSTIIENVRKILRSSPAPNVDWSPAYEE